MRIRNRSSYDTDWLRPLLDFAGKGINLTGCLVEIEDCKFNRISGTAYSKGWLRCNGVKLPATCIDRVVLRLPKGVIPVSGYNLHHTKWMQKLWPNANCMTREDCVVSLAAHEFRHIWQYRVGNPRRRKKGLKTILGELDAEKHETKILNRWREHTGRPPYLKVTQPNPFEARAAACRAR